MSDSPTPGNSQNRSSNNDNGAPNNGAPEGTSSEGDGRAPHPELISLEPSLEGIGAYEAALQGVDLHMLREIIRHQEKRGVPNPIKLVAAQRELIARMKNQTQGLVMRLQTYGEAPSDLLDTGSGQPPTEPTDEPDGPLTSEHPLDGCEPFPDAVFTDLPEVLNETCGFWSRRHKRDVFLTSALGLLSGCLPNVKGYWGADVPSQVQPNLFTLFAAGASGGKSAGNFARKLVRGVADRIKKKSADALKDWKDERAAADAAGEPFDVPRPPNRSFYVPADISSTHLLDVLSKQDERGVIYSSEIDTLLNALGQDWGQIDSFLRKAFHHEADDKGRRSDGTIGVWNPSVSLVLGGTVDQLVNLIESPENGLYSRLCVYFFDTFDTWQSQRPTRAGIDRLERFDALSARVADLWSTLKGRREPLRFEITDAHWRQIDSAFSPLHREVQEQGFKHLTSVVRRGALWAFRIAMILSVMRAHDDGAPLQRLDTVEATDTDVNTALRIAKTYADHSIRFARGKLNDAEPVSPRDRRIAAMLSGIGIRFSSGAAYDAARAAGFDASTRTLRKDLKAAERRGLIRCVRKGKWERLQSEGTSDASDTSDDLE